MNDRDETRRDAAAEAAWRLLEDEELDVRAPGLDDEVRRHVEVLGLVGLSVEPVAPSAQLERRVLDAVRAADARPAERTASVSVMPRPEVPVEPRWPWAAALAAALAFCVVGLGTLSFTLHRELDEQRAVAARQQVAIDRLEQAVSSSGSSVELATLRDDLRAIETRFRIVTGPETEVCALEPPDGERSPMPQARATLFIAADHQHWYLKARGLEPLAEGSYQLWFVPENGEPVSAGAFVVVDEEIELSSEQMPANTRAVLVTLEREPSTKPNGPVVLYGDEAMLLL